MKTRTALLALLLAALSFAAASPLSAQSAEDKLYKNQYALVIGISNYQNPEKWPVITNARNDAREFAEFLEMSGFKVKTIYDKEATRQAILKELENVAAAVGEEDAVIVFFAGHGATKSIGPTDKGYIVPWEGTEDTYISMSELQDYSQGMGRAKHQLFIMDSCYGGSLGASNAERSAKPTADSDPPPKSPSFAFIRSLAGPKARQVLTAGGKNQKVLDGGGVYPGHSVFTGALLKGLRDKEADVDKDGYITFSELRYYIRKNAFVEGQQSPHSDILAEHKGDKDFVFVASRLRVTISPRVELLEESQKPINQLQMRAAQFLQSDLIKAQENQKLSNVRFDLDSNSEGILTRGERTSDTVADTSAKQGDYTLELRYLPLDGGRVRMEARFRKASKDLKDIAPVAVELESWAKLGPLVQGILQRFASETVSLHLKPAAFENCPPEIKEQMIGAIKGWAAQLKLARFRYSEEKYAGDPGSVAIEPLIDVVAEGGKPVATVTFVVEQAGKERLMPSRTAPLADWKNALQELQRDMEAILAGLVK